MSWHPINLSWPDKVLASEPKPNDDPIQSDIEQATSGLNLQFSDIIVIIDIPPIEPADTKKIAPSEVSDVNEEEELEEPGPSKRKSRKRVGKFLEPNQFVKWNEDEVDKDIPNRGDWKDHWGRKPTLNDPLPHPLQPAARTSDAAVRPALWEDRKFRIKRGTQHVKFFGPIAPDNADSLPATLDQEESLVLKLIDMRPRSKTNPLPRRAPMVYKYDRGKPSDWNDMQTIKCINDRRDQAISRITIDAPWTRIEREYLASLCVDFPNASIWEMTQRFNSRFMGHEFAADTAFSSTPVHDGRTVESVRAEYITYKPNYDNCEAPNNLRYRIDKSQTARESQLKMESVFGLADRSLQKSWDRRGAGDYGSEEDRDGPIREGSESENSQASNQLKIDETDEKPSGLAGTDHENEMQDLTLPLPGSPELANGSAVLEEHGNDMASEFPPHVDDDGDIQMSEDEDRGATTTVMTNGQQYSTGAMRYMEIDENYSDEDEEVCPP